MGGCMDVMANHARAMKRPRVLLADDHQMVADALKSVLEPRCEVVGTVNNGHALLQAAPSLQPEVTTAPGRASGYVQNCIATVRILHCLSQLAIAFSSAVVQPQRPNRWLSRSGRTGTASG